MFNLKRNALIIIGLILFASVATPQVILEEETTSNGFGGMMAFESTSKVLLVPDAKRQTSRTEFTGTFMKNLAPATETIEITRLDKELIWNINPKQKEYSEMTFAQFREFFQKGMSSKEMPQQPDAVDKSEYEWEKPVVKVTKGQASQKINGFKCNNYIVNVMTVGKHKKTGIRDTMQVVNDLWQSEVNAKAMQQIQDFHQRMMQKMGLEQPMKGMAQMFALYKEYFEAMSKEIQKLEGFPIRSTVSMKTTDHVAAASGKSETSEANNETADLRNSPLSGLLGGLAKKLAQQQSAQPSNDSARELFRFTTEVKSIKMQEINPQEFEIPAGFKQVKADNFPMAR